MIFKSKTVFDPNKAEQFPWGNRMGRTIGLEFRLPKYWNCRKKDFDLGWLWVSPPIPESMKASRYQEAIRHTHCRWPYLHKIDKGLIYWWGPKRRYTFRYQGQRGSYDPRSPFSVEEHKLYMRWLDNGAQNSQQKPIEPELIKVIQRHYHEEATQIHREMNEYRRRMEAEYR